MLPEPSQDSAGRTRFHAVAGSPADCAVPNAMVRNAGSVRKVRRRGRVRWVIDFLYIEGGGRVRRYRRDARVQTAAGARAEAARLQTIAVTTGTLTTRAAAPTLATFARGQFAALFMTRFRPSTRRRYEGLLRQGLLDLLGSKRIDEIGPSDARGLAATLAERGIGVKPYAVLLGTLLRAAFELGLLETGPKLPRLHRESRKLPDCPGREEVNAMLTEGTGWIRVAIALGAFAGLRLGEVRALEVQDVDLADGVIRVRRSFSDDVVMTPKSGHERIVPMTPELHAVMTEAVRGKLPRARVISTENGTTPRRTYVLRKFKALQRRLSLPGWSFHSLRHAFISELVRAGASIEAVRLLAGHSKLDVTQRYVHATGEDVRAAVAKLAVG